MQQLAIKKKPELLAPAGELAAAYAAFHYGADAVYAGLKSFSARAEAVNLSLDELGQVVAYAHSLSPIRRVYLTLNTLIQQEEISGIISHLEEAVFRGIDAVIVQDLGLVRLIDRHFPGLRMHASTQLAVHNLAGATVAKQLGFARVTLARELAANEIAAISSRCEIETEIFIHGALCYSYSGLCLYSSILRGRSGNRGRCLYPCRNLFSALDTSGKAGQATLPFSMRDLALWEYFGEINQLGAASLKIEGRKKSPLYVAVATHLYRSLLDENCSVKEIKEIAADLATVFGRSTSSLYFSTSGNQRVIDPRSSGHRGQPIGIVKSIRKVGSKNRVCFSSSRPIECHDGLQITLPGKVEPFGFAVGTLWKRRAGEKRFKFSHQASPGDLIEVELPIDAPFIPEGAQLCCSSSQAVKQRYRFDLPKQGAFSTTVPLSITIEILPERLRVQAGLQSLGLERAKVEFELALAENSRLENQDSFKLAVHSSFSKLGGTIFAVGQLEIINSASTFVPVSVLNRARREMVKRLETLLAVVRRTRLNRIVSDCTETEGIIQSKADLQLAWSIKIDRSCLLDNLSEKEWKRVAEVILEIDLDPLSLIEKKLTDWTKYITTEQIRLALPIITRAKEEKGLRQKLAKLRQAGWRKWQVSNLSGWHFLDYNNAIQSAQLDLTVDWPCYALNRLAALKLLESGASGFTISPEDRLENCLSLLREFGKRATVVVYQDTPLFISESAPKMKVNLKSQNQICSQCAEELVVLTRSGRTIVISQKALSREGWIPALIQNGFGNFRIDFIFRNYSPAEVLQIWRTKVLADIPRSLPA